MKKDLTKVAIIGHGAPGLHHALAELLKDYGVIIATPDQINDYTEALKQYQRPDPIVIELKPQPVFELPFREPITRAQRRANERKLKKHKL